MSRTRKPAAAAQAQAPAEDLTAEKAAALPAALAATARAIVAADPALADIEPEPVPRGYWRRADGSLVPVSKVAEIDKARTALVEQLVEEAQVVSTELAAFKMDAMQRISDFVQLSAAQFDAKVRGNKGNLTLMTFDGRFKIVRQVAEVVAFDERLQIAKSLIDGCIHTWSKGANANLKTIVGRAFQVDKEGQVSVARILTLRSYEITDEAWTQAMKAIADSVTTTSTKAYLRFYQRNDATGEYIPIPLDASAL